MRLVGGRYELGEEIGRGGMAQVHAAYDTRLGRRVAVKMLHAGRVGDKIFLARFRREAQAAAGLTHPNIVAVYDSGEDIVDTPNGQEVVPFIVMELVEGRTLSQLMHDEGALTIPEALKVTEGVLTALGYSHAHGVVHRDIKPGNVMVNTSGDVKVMDFGIARGGAGDATATMTQTQSVVGTAQYLSPEQARGLDVDGRSDLYSAGCLLFELVTGRPPFVGDSPLAIAYQHVGEDPATPSTYNPAISHELDAVILHALIKDRDRRYQNADAFIADVRAVREGHALSPAARATSEAAFAPTEAMSMSGTGTSSAVLPPVVEPLADPAVAATGAHVGTPVGPNTGPMPAVDERRRSPLLWLLPLLLVAALIGAGVWWFNRPAPVELKTVPALVGKTEMDAKKLLADRGFSGNFTHSPNGRPSGEVFGQHPLGGTKADPNEKVVVDVSTGPSEVVVPPVRNMTVASAKTSLQAIGLTKTREEQVDSATVPEGQVVKTDPDSGVKVPRAAVITLYVSTGKVAMLNVEGQNRDDAAKALNQAGFRVSFKDEVTVDSPDGTVITQDPKSGSYPPGTKVTLVIAKQPPPAPTVVTSTATVTETASPTPSPSPTHSSPTPKPTPPRPTDSGTPTPTPSPTTSPSTSPTPSPTSTSTPTPFF